MGGQVPCLRDGLGRKPCVLSVDGRAVNDSSIAEVKNARYRSVENPFRQPHYLLVNLALGGDVTKVPFPVHMYVDYVRVYQKAE